MVVPGMQQRFTGYDFGQNIGQQLQNIPRNFLDAVRMKNQKELNVRKLDQFDRQLSQTDRKIGQEDRQLDFIEKQYGDQQGLIKVKRDANQKARKEIAKMRETNYRQAEWDRGYNEYLDKESFWGTKDQLKEEYETGNVPRRWLFGDPKQIESAGLRPTVEAPDVSSYDYIPEQYPSVGDTFDQYNPENLLDLLKYGGTQ